MATWGDADAILGHDDIRDTGFDPNVPACLLLACVLHFVDAPTAHGIVAAFTRALAPRSHVIISVGFAPDQADRDFAKTYNAQSGPRIYSHSRAEITAMFYGLELVPPGLVGASDWQAAAAHYPAAAGGHDRGRGRSTAGLGTAGSGGGGGLGHASSPFGLHGF